MAFSLLPLFLVCLMVLTTICYCNPDKDSEHQERTLGILAPAFGSFAKNLGNLIAGPGYYSIPRPSHYNYNYGFGESGHRPSYYGGYHSTGFQGFPGTEFHSYHSTGSHSHHSTGSHSHHSTGSHSHHGTGFQGFPGDHPFSKK